MLIAYFHHMNSSKHNVGMTKFRLIVRKPDDVIVEVLHLDALGGNAWGPACLDDSQVVKILAHALLKLQREATDSERDGFNIGEVKL